MSHRTFAAGLTLGALLVATAPSAGQDSLGGYALDGSLFGGPNSLNQAAPLANYRSRNLLVTGNVVGGRGFRETVGYTAEFDFRGDTGSDDLFAERANSALSAPNFFTGGRTMDMVRYGQYLNEVEYQSATRGSTIQNFNSRLYVPDYLNDQRLRLDQIAISSTTSAIFDSAADSRIVGILRDSEGNAVTATASSLMGLQFTPLDRQGRVIGLSSYDLARTGDDFRSGQPGPKLGAPFESGFQNLLSADLRTQARPEPITSRLDPAISNARLDYGAEPSYLEILQRVAERSGAAVDAQTTPQVLADLDQQFADLREFMAEVYGDETAEQTEGETEPAIPGIPDTPAAIAALAGPLQHDQSIEHFVHNDPSRFGELMASAEERLATGQYFWAERHFERALRFTPGHPLATAGIGHARIGAGLYVSAALTLRRLMTTNPEMIDVRYEPRLLPSRIRLDLAVTRLRELAATSDRDRGLYGFLLAYLGHQFDDAALVAEGLDLMGNEPLRNLLQAVWLD